MHPTDEILDSIRLYEADNLGFSGGLNRGDKGTLAKTARAKIRIDIAPDLTEKTFTTNKVGPVIMAVCLAVPLVVVLVATLTKPATNNLVAVILIFFLLGIALYSYLRDHLWDTNRNYLLTVSQEGIAFNETVYPWSRIEETAVIHYRKSKVTRSFLLLLLTDASYEIREISNFSGSLWGGFSNILATYIEHYKALYQRKVV